MFTLPVVAMRLVLGSNSGHFGVEFGELRGKKIAISEQAEIHYKTPTKSTFTIEKAPNLTRFYSFAGVF